MKVPQRAQARAAEKPGCSEHWASEIASRASRKSDMEGRSTATPAPRRQVPSGKISRLHPQIQPNRFSRLDPRNSPLATHWLPRRLFPLIGGPSHSRNEPLERTAPGKIHGGGALHLAGGATNLDCCASIASRLREDLRHHGPARRVESIVGSARPRRRQHSCPKGPLVGTRKASVQESRGKESNSTPQRGTRYTPTCPADRCQWRYEDEPGSTGAGAFTSIPSRRSSSMPAAIANVPGGLSYQPGSA